jgi:hypothetical protein
MSALEVKGTLHFNQYKNGVFQGRKELRGVTQMELKQSVDMERQQSKDKDTYGMTTATIAKRKPTELNFKLQNFDRQSVALALMGDAVTVSTGSGTITDEAITAKLGCSVDLAHKNIAANSVVVTNSGSSTTYVEGTDYTVNYAQGWITALASGAITEAQSLKVDYGYNARSGFKVESESLSMFKGELFLDGENLADGTQVEVLIPMATFTSNTGLDFMSDKFVEFQFSGSAELYGANKTTYIVTNVTNA